MDYLIICSVALIVAGLTFFSGFGLGTLLMPAFALFFPVELAIAATAVVHLLNNIFKTGLVGKYADKKTVLLFAIPAAALAIVGASLLNYFSGLDSFYDYTLFGKVFSITPIKVAIGLLILLFAILELLPSFKTISFKSRYIPLGGALSGFFGGLSGHQGALRTAFLIRTGLQKEALIGTMVIASIMVDIARLSVYGLTFISEDFILLQQRSGLNLMMAGTVAAFIGSFLGARLLKKITLKTLKMFIAVMLLFIAFGLGLGII